MSQNFTRYAFTDSVRKEQERNGTRDAYAAVERSGDRYRLTGREVSFIQLRDSFYIATVGDNGWPYVQFRGGEAGFLRVIDETTIGYADFRGNGQYISTGNIRSNNKAALILMDYPQRRRLKVWAESRVVYPETDQTLLDRLCVPGYEAKIERLILFDVQAYDWNCPRHIIPRYTLEEIDALAQAE